MRVYTAIPSILLLHLNNCIAWADELWRIQYSYIHSIRVYARGYLQSLWLRTSAFWFMPVFTATWNSKSCNHHHHACMQNPFNVSELSCLWSFCKKLNRARRNYCFPIKFQYIKEKTNHVYTQLPVCKWTQQITVYSDMSTLYAWSESG
jgi:hypothetical protein